VYSDGREAASPVTVCSITISSMPKCS
jgi:hypothetical protein